MPITLDQLVQDLARAWERVDATAPRSKNYPPGLGAFDEKDLVKRLLEDLHTLDPAAYGGPETREAPYRSGSAGDLCDLCLGHAGAWDWALEVKVARLLRSTGGIEPAAVSHILSPYGESALYDCTKILRFAPTKARGIVIIGYDYPGLPLSALIDDFEVLARRRVSLGTRAEAEFSGSVHPYHRKGCIMAWEVKPLEG